MDTDGDGFLTMEEFKVGTLKDPSIVSTLDSYPAASRESIHSRVYPILSFIDTSTMPVLNQSAAYKTPFSLLFKSLKS